MKTQQTPENPEHPPVTVRQMIDAGLMTPAPKYDTGPTIDSPLDWDARITAPQDQDQRLSDAVAGLVACTDPGESKAETGKKLTVWLARQPEVKAALAQDPASHVAGHSPLPWTLEQGDNETHIVGPMPDDYAIIARLGDWVVRPEEQEANAAYIVKACNEHDELLCALNNARQDVAWVESQRDKTLAHAQRLADALQGWQDWTQGKRAWPKLETNEALAQWEQDKQYANEKQKPKTT